MQVAKLPGSRANWLYHHGERLHGGIGRSWDTKDTASAGAAVTGIGLSGAQSVTGTTTTVALGLSEANPWIASAAVGVTSATGVGLVVGAAALSLLGAGLAARSAYKTHKHMRGLKFIQDNAWRLRDCMPRLSEHERILSGMTAATPQLDHYYLENVVLPYIYMKKRAKRGRKGAKAIVPLSPFESARGILKNVYKRRKRSLGVHRHNAAQWLAYHFQSCYCPLARATVAELLSTGEMNRLQITSGSVVVEALERKIKSV